MLRAPAQNPFGKLRKRLAIRVGVTTVAYAVAVVGGGLGGMGAALVVGGLASKAASRLADWLYPPDDLVAYVRCAAATAVVSLDEIAAANVDQQPADSPLPALPAPLSSTA